MPLKCGWHTPEASLQVLETSFSNIWNTLKTSWKCRLKTLETPLKHPWYTLKSSMEHNRNTKLSSYRFIYINELWKIKDNKWYCWAYILFVDLQIDLILSIVHGAQNNQLDLNAKWYTAKVEIMCQNLLVLFLYGTLIHHI